MTILTAMPVSANTARRDDAHHELAYKGLCFAFGLSESEPFDLTTLDPELLPIDAPRLPCGCGCGDRLVRIDEAAQGFCLGHRKQEISR